MSYELDKPCGKCKHWHERKERKGLRTGDCDKIAKGTLYNIGDKTYTYDGYSFEDEYYDDCFNCFEELVNCEYKTITEDEENDKNA